MQAPTPVARPRIADAVVLLAVFVDLGALNAIRPSPPQSLVQPAERQAEKRQGAAGHAVDDVVVAGHDDCRCHEIAMRVPRSANDYRRLAQRTGELGESLGHLVKRIRVRYRHAQRTEDYQRRECVQGPPRSAGP